MDINKLIQIAYQHYLSGNLRQAELICEKIITKQPKNIDTLNLIGVIYHQEGNSDSAIRNLNKALQLNPSLSDAQRGRERVEALMVSG